MEKIFFFDGVYKYKHFTCDYAHGSLEGLLRELYVCCKLKHIDHTEATIKIWYVTDGGDEKQYLPLTVHGIENGRYELYNSESGEVIRDSRFED